ncbi:MAG: extracellular solute-binding protein [Protaetiibacter sp.]
MYTKRTMPVIALGAVAAMMMAGCAATPAEDEDVTLNFAWWGADDRAAMYEEALDIYREENPNVTITTQSAGFADYWTARSAEAASGSLPDVLQTDLSYLDEYSANGQLLDLTPYLDDGTIDEAGFDAALLASGEANDALVALPTGSNMLSVITNLGLVEKAGVASPELGYTWEDYYTYLTSISAAGITTDAGQPVYGGGSIAGNIWSFLLWLVQQGIDPVASDGSLGFGEDEVVAWLELAYPDELRDSGELFPIDRLASLAPLDGFGAQEAALQIQYDNFLATYAAQTESTQLSLQPLPVVEGTDPLYFSKPAMFLSIGANSEHPAEAAKLISFLLTDPRVGEIFGTSKGVPAYDAQREAVLDGADDTVKAILAYEESIAEYATAPVPVLPHHSTLESKWSELIERLMYNDITREDFASEWFAEVDIALG